jgi:hypothetical protein
MVVAFLMGLELKRASMWARVRRISFHNNNNNNNNNNLSFFSSSKN